MYFPDGYHHPDPRKILRDGVELRQVADTIYLIENGSVVESFPSARLLAWLTDHGNILTDRYHPAEPDDRIEPDHPDYTPPIRLTLTIDYPEPVYRSPDR